MIELFKRIQATLTASATTSIEAKLGRFERGLLIAGGLSFLTLLTGLIFSTFASSLIAYVVTGIGLFCLVLVIAFWILQHFIFRTEGTPTIFIGPDGSVLQTQLNNPEKNIKELRQLVLARQAPPIADGEVLNGDIKDPNNIRHYSDDEKRRQDTQLRQKLDKFEDDLIQRVVGQIQLGADDTEAAKQLAVQTLPIKKPDAGDQLPPV